MRQIEIDKKDRDHKEKEDVALLKIKALKE
jgi:hypothetical protein